jgi:hypothetical protein
MNEWMRQHQRIVLTFALLAMVGTGFYGVTYMVQGPGGQGRGPGGAYFAMDGRRMSVEPEELYQERLLRWHLNASRGDYPGSAVLQRLAQLQLCKDMGVEMGNKELIGVEKEDIKGRTRQSHVDETLLRNLLEDLQITHSQYERLLREDSTVQKVVELFRGQVRVSEGEQYLGYCQRKQIVRLFFKEFHAKDYEELAGDPSAEEIRTYYDEYSVPPKSGEGEHAVADRLDSEPMLSIDVLYMPRDLVIQQIKPAEEELKKYYQDWRTMYRRPLESGKPAPEGDEAFRTYDEAKEDVLKDFLREKASGQANELKAKLEKAIEEAEKKAAESKTPFDWAGFAEKQGLTYWRTEKLKQRGFEKGSENIKAPDFRVAGDPLLFRLAQKGEDEAAEQKLVAERKRFSGSRRILHGTPEEGFVMFRLAEYQGKALMGLEDATPVIRRRLREQRAQDKAAEAAKEFREKWLKGDAVPKPGDLKDETCFSSQTAPVRNPLFSDLMRNPKPVGELLPVSPFQADDEVAKDRPDTRFGRFLVGFAAEMDTPKYADYEMDSLDREGAMMRQYQAMMRGRDMAWDAHQFLWKFQGYEMESTREIPLSARGPMSEPPPE